jgi:hypothetical protein
MGRLANTISGSPFASNALTSLVPTSPVAPAISDVFIFLSSDKTDLMKQKSTLQWTKGLSRTNFAIGQFTFHFRILNAPHNSMFQKNQNQFFRNSLMSFIETSGWS